MAEEEKEAQAEQEVEAQGSDGLGDDLMDLFTGEEESYDPTLGLLTASLEDVDLMDLLEQVREIQDIMRNR